MYLVKCFDPNRIACCYMPACWSLFVPAQVLPLGDSDSDLYTRVRERLEHAFTRLGLFRDANPLDFADDPTEGQSIISNGRALVYYSSRQGVEQLARYLQEQAALPASALGNVEFMWAHGGDEDEHKEHNLSVLQAFKAMDRKWKVRGLPPVGLASYPSLL